MKTWSIENYKNYDQVLNILRTTLKTNTVYWPMDLKEKVKQAIEKADSDLKESDYRKIIGKLYKLFSVNVDAKWYVKLIPLKRL